MNLQIKWRDQRDGHLKFERWVRISEAKAQEMMKRAFGTDYEHMRLELQEGTEVSTKRWVIKNTEPAALAAYDPFAGIKYKPHTGTVVGVDKALPGSNRAVIWTGRYTFVPAEVYHQKRPIPAGSLKADDTLRIQATLEKTGSFALELLKDIQAQVDNVVGVPEKLISSKP